MADIRTIKKFVRLWKEREGLKDQVAKLDHAIKALEESVINYLLQQGLDRLTQDGRTVYSRIDYYPGKCEGVSDQQLSSALEQARLAEYISTKANLQSLRGYLNEVRKRDEDIFQLHPELEGVLKINEVPRVGCRAS